MFLRMNFKIKYLEVKVEIFHLISVIRRHLLLTISFCLFFSILLTFSLTFCASLFPGFFLHRFRSNGFCYCSSDGFQHIIISSVSYESSHLCNSILLLPLFYLYCKHDFTKLLILVSVACLHCCVKIHFQHGLTFFYYINYKCIVF